MPVPASARSMRWRPPSPSSRSGAAALRLPLARPTRLEELSALAETPPPTRSSASAMASTTAFQLCKDYGTGIATYKRREITKPWAGEVLIAVDGFVQPQPGSVACDPATGLADLRATGMFRASGTSRHRRLSFDVPVRFDIDDRGRSLGFRGRRDPEIPDHRNHALRWPCAIFPPLSPPISSRVRRRLCRCWSLTRRDGLVLGFTDHDRALAFDGIGFAAVDRARSGRDSRRARLRHWRRRGRGRLRRDRAERGRSGARAL
jgi:hypothetical protein